MMILLSIPIVKLLVLVSRTKDAACAKLQFLECPYDCARDYFCDPARHECVQCRDICAPIKNKNTTHNIFARVCINKCPGEKVYVCKMLNNNRVAITIIRRWDVSPSLRRCNDISLQPNVCGELDYVIRHAKKVITTTAPPSVKVVANSTRKNDNLNILFMALFILLFGLFCMTIVLVCGLPYKYMHDLESPNQCGNYRQKLKMLLNLIHINKDNTKINVDLSKTGPNETHTNVRQEAQNAENKGEMVVSGMNSTQSIDTHWRRTPSQQNVKETERPRNNNLEKQNAGNNSETTKHEKRNRAVRVSQHERNESETDETKLNNDESMHRMHVYNRTDNVTAGTEKSEKSTSTTDSLCCVSSDSFSSRNLETKFTETNAVASNSRDSGQFVIDNSLSVIDCEANRSIREDYLDSRQHTGQLGQLNTYSSTCIKSPAPDVYFSSIETHTNPKSLAQRSLSNRESDQRNYSKHQISKNTGVYISNTHDISLKQLENENIENTPFLERENKSYISKESCNGEASNRGVPAQLSIALSLETEEAEHLRPPIQQNQDFDVNMGESEVLESYMQQQDADRQALINGSQHSLPYIRQQNPVHLHTHANAHVLPSIPQNEDLLSDVDRNEPCYSDVHKHASNTSRHSNEILRHSGEDEYFLPRLQGSNSLETGAVEPEEHLIEACQPQSGHHYDGLDGQRFPDEPQAAENEALLGAVGGFVGNLDEAYNEVQPPENDPLRSLPDELLARSYDSDSGAGSIVDPAFQNRSGFHELHYDNNYIYEQLQNIPWILGYHSQGRSISIYCDLDNVEAEERHRELCTATHQPWNKYRIKPHHD